MKRLNIVLGAVLAVLFAAPASADRLTLPSVGNSFIDDGIAIFQTWLDALTGPWGIAIACFGLAAALTLWFFSPKEGFVGTAMRVFAFAIGVLNIPGAVIALQF